MAIPRSTVEEVLARTDIVALIGQTVTLRRNGRNFVGLCPFHNEKTPSFNVLPVKGIFHCFGCGEGGDAVAWLRKTRGLSFVEAVKDLAGPAGVIIEERQLSPAEQRQVAQKTDLYAVCDLACTHFHTTLLTAPEGAPSRAYLERRGVTLDTARKYRIGYAPEGWTRLVDTLQRRRIPVELALESGVAKKSDRAENRIYDTFRNRLIFPIVDERERPIAFGGRLLEGEGPKYLNSPESPIYEKSKILYGLSWARAHAQKSDRLLLVEGYFDAVSLWQAGFGEAVATCGTALTPQHLEAARKLTRKMIALFDSDEAGLRAATKAMELFVQAEISAFRLDLADAKDPDEYIQRHGADAFEERLRHVEPLIDLVIRRTVAREGTDGVARGRVEDALVGLLRRLPDRMREETTLKLAAELNIKEATLRARIAAAPADRIAERTPGPSSAAPPRPAAPPPSRWTPSEELSRLLWLLVHYPDHVAPVLAEVDPDVITDRRDLLRVMVRLGEGVPLTAVLDAVDDPELARHLIAISARPTEYEEEQAESVTVRLIAALELPRVEARLRAVNGQIAVALTSGDKTSYASLKAELSSLNARHHELKTVRASRAPR